MRKIINLCALLLGLSALSFTLHAAPPTNQPDISTAEKNAVKRSFDKLAKESGKKIPITSISRTPVPGVLEVTSDLNIFYITTDGEYLFYGDLLHPSDSKDKWSLTEQTLRKLRLQALATVDQKDMIIYPSTAKKQIGIATIFTDIDCPYCHKLQEHMKEYNDLGIEIRYLSFPRTGPKTASFDEAIKIWCAPDKAKAYANAIATQVYPTETCKNNPVMMEYELGQRMGINGTPTIILDNGAKLGGLVEPKELAKIIAESRK